MTQRLHLFEAVGIELEYMIVDRATLDVRPVADRLLQAQTGRVTGDAEFDDGIAWSNELVAHVVELKTATPWRGPLHQLARLFHRHVQRANRLLADIDATLLPTAMHPWMDPHTQTVLWPHECSEVYEAFDRIFDARGHGWSNLQSMHINLPFANDDEFARLHAAIRLLLPVLPALAASSPVMDGRVTGTLDNRLAVYRTNSARVPSVAGRVVPEPVFSEAEYRRDILEKIWADLAPHDPDAVLRDEFANARGAIARFGRGSIEIRVIDLQECPAADLALAELVIATARALSEERWAPLAEIQAWPVEPLAELFDGCVRRAENQPLTDAAYLRAFGLTPAEAPTAGDLWRRLAERLTPGLAAPGPTLATRIARALPGSPGRDDLHRVYRRLAQALADDRAFAP